MTAPGEGFTLGQKIEAAVGAAIEKVIAECEHGFAIKWLAIVESAGPDGTRGVWTMTSSGALPWETLGLLEYGKLRHLTVSQ